MKDAASGNPRPRPTHLRAVIWCIFDVSPFEEEDASTSAVGGWQFLLHNPSLLPLYCPRLDGA